MDLMQTGLTPEQMERFWSCIEKREDGCWIYKPKSESFRVDRYRSLRPSRIVVDEVMGRPGWRVYRKTCGIVKCCAPEHMLLKEAVDDGK